MSVESEARGARAVDRAVAHYVIQIAGPEPSCGLCERALSPYVAVVYRGEVFCRDCIAIKLGAPPAASAAAGSSLPSRGAAGSRSAASGLPAEKAA